MWNTETGALKSRGITLKSDIRFVSVYLQKKKILKVPLRFDLPSYISVFKL
jgi:hypothetical protein